ncbi:MAG: aminopeptidase P family protein [Ruminococcaceae bacterium]|nr:aminopeptidase P family protein [Oscillospiraceae bacterium]
MTRIDKMRNVLKERGLDAIVVLDELNQHYLSGFAFTDGLLLITMHKALLITDFRYYEMAQNEAYPEFEIMMPENRTKVITDTLKEESCKKVGFEGDSVSFATYKKYAETYPDCEFISVGNAIEELREIKDESEIALMQKAQDITDYAFSELVKHINTNMTEIEVAAELEYFMRKSGASGFAFETIAVSGDASALPHGTPRNVKLKPGFLTMDFGAKYKGYCSDMTRTIVIGKADEKIKKLYATVLEAQRLGLEAVKAGADGKECDDVARNYIDSFEEYKGAFGHSLGHGVGLFIHETPRLSKAGAGRKLRVGEIVTVEPGIYLYGKYGCRIEDMVAVTENGNYNFTHSTKELIEII